MPGLSASVFLATLATVAAQATSACANVASYYSGITGTTGATLRSQLHNLIDAHNIIPYSSSGFGDAYDALENIDRIYTSGGSPTNTVRTIYSFPRTANLQYDNGNGWNRHVSSAPMPCLRAPPSDQANKCMHACAAGSIRGQSRSMSARLERIRRTFMPSSPPCVARCSDQKNPDQLDRVPFDPLVHASLIASRGANCYDAHSSSLTSLLLHLTGRERQLGARQQAFLQLRIHLQRGPCASGSGPDCQRERGLLDATDRPTRRHRKGTVLHVREHSRHSRPAPRL
eukprot:6180761-Pleurochrysis_carterae.AAC.2